MSHSNRLHCAINATKACAVFLVHSILPLCPSPSCSASLVSPGLLSEGVVMYLRDRERGRLGGEEVCSILLLSPLCPTSLSSPPATEVDCYLSDGLIFVSPLFSVSSHVLLSERDKRHCPQISISPRRRWEGTSGPAQILRLLLFLLLSFAASCALN